MEKEKEISEKKMEEIQSVNDKYIEEKQERRKTLEALNLSLKQSQEQLEKLKHKFKESKVQLKNISENSEKLTKKIIREKDQEIRDLNIMLNMKKDELNELNVKMKQSPCKTEIKEEKSQPKISQRPLDSCQGTSKDAKSIEVTKDAKSTDTAKAEKSPINHSEGSARKRESPSGEEQVLQILLFHK